MKRTLAIILAVVMLVSLFAGCNNNSSASTTAAAASTTAAAASTTKAAASTTKAAASTTAAAAPANPYEEHMDITFASHYMQGLDPNNPLQKELEEMFNVTFDCPDMDLNSDFATFKLKVTAGEIPDITMMNQSLALVLEWYDNEVIRTIPVELIRTYAPAWAKVMDADPAGWKVYPVEGTDDEIMAMTGYMPKQMQYGCWNDYYRYDYLQQLGVEVPGAQLVNNDFDYLYYSEQTFTLDEQYAIFEKALTTDLNGDGQLNEKITTGYPNYYMHGFQSILGAFGLVQNQNIEENGVTKYPYATEAFKEGMKYLHKMYEAGMIDEDFASSAWSNNNEKYRTGLYLYHAGNADYMYDDSTREAGTGGWARAPFTMITDFPEGSIITMPPVKSASGVNNSGYYAVSPFRYQTVFGEQCDDVKMARILSFFNYSMWDDATYEPFYYGREGIEWTWQDNGRGEMIRVGDPELAPSAVSGIYVFCQGMFELVGRGDQFSTSFAKDLHKVKTSAGFMEAAAGPHRLDLYNETNLAALSAENSATISTIVDEWWIGVICGTVDADASWDSYLAQLNAAGYAEMEAELNKAPLYTDLFPTMKSGNK